MTEQKYKVIGSSSTTPIENTKRKEVTVGKVLTFSQQVDLSDFIGMDPDTKAAIESLPFEFRTRTGAVLLKGKTDNLADTARVFTEKEEDIVLYVGDGAWSLSVDCNHER